METFEARANRIEKKKREEASSRNKTETIFGELANEDFVKFKHQVELIDGLSVKIISPRCVEIFRDTCGGVLCEVFSVFHSDGQGFSVRGPSRRDTSQGGLTSSSAEIADNISSLDELMDVTSPYIVKAKNAYNDDLKRRKDIERSNNTKSVIASSFLGAIVLFVFWAISQIR